MCKGVALHLESRVAGAQVLVFDLPPESALASAA
jgi:hypothetical protein